MDRTLTPSLDHTHTHYILTDMQCCTESSDNNECTGSPAKKREKKRKETTLQGPAIYWTIFSCHRNLYLQPFTFTVVRYCIKMFLTHR